MKYLITGGCGFLGTNIASELLRKGEETLIFDNLSRLGSTQNLAWLQSQGAVTFIHGDIRNTNDVTRTIKANQPEVVFHLAGQVAMITSIADPRLDFEVNAGGSFNLLNAVRQHSPASTIIYSSTNKVYGDLEQFRYEETATRYRCLDKPDGFDESVNLDFHSPYGASKGSADQYMLDFARIYGLKTIVFRHSSMYGGRQFATYDQGWLGWFAAQAIAIKNGALQEPFTISGNGKQVRDLLYASDTVALYVQAAAHSEALKGQAFNIGGGPDNSSSLLELFAFLEAELAIQMTFRQTPARQSDQRVFVADNSKIERFIGWKPQVSKQAGIRNMLEWLRSPC
jgi:CDP-paratose 2-epimerase